MRKIILGLLLLVSGYVMAQPTNYIPYQSRNRWISGVFDSTFHVPRGATPSLRVGGWNNGGALFYNTSDSSLYVYTGYQWRKLGEGGGADSSIFATIYRTDTLSQNIRNEILWTLSDTIVRTKDTTKYVSVGTDKSFGYFTAAKLDIQNPIISEDYATTALFIKEDGTFRAGSWDKGISIRPDSMGAGSVAIGNGSKAKGYKSAAFLQGIALGDESIAFGGQANGYGSLSFKGVANGEYSVALTEGAVADGFGSVSLNDGYTTGVYSAAVNAGRADGVRSFSANGGYSIGELSSSFGNGLTVTGYSSFGIGLNGGGANITEDSVFAVMGGKSGFNTVSPDSTVTVNGGVHFQRGVRLSNLPNGGVSADSVLVVAADGEVKKRNAADFGGGGSGTVTSVATNTGTGITGGTITNTGTIAADTLKLSTRLWRQKGIDSVQSNLTTGLSGKVSTSRSISTTSPLSGGGDLSADRTLSIANAAADGATKGAAAFTAADFDASSGVISIDYTNGQKATKTQPGFATAAQIARLDSNQFVKPGEGIDTVWTNDSTLTIKMKYDTTALASYGAGSGAAGDTSAFSTSALYGSFYNSGSDTLIITRMQIGLQGTSPSITLDVYWNDSLNVSAGATKLVTAGSSATNIYTGTSVTSFDNTKIAPGNWVWVKSSAVTTKPTYLSLTLIGYKKRVNP